jgi:hypothetical protein
MIDETEVRGIPLASVPVQHGLLERLKAIWDAAWGNMPAPVEKPAPKGEADANYIKSVVTQMSEAFHVSNDRLSKLADYRVMDKGYIATLLDQIVAASLTFEGNSGPATDVLSENRCFKVELGGYGTSAPAQVIRQILVDTRLRQRLPRYARDLLRDGDLFLEPLIDDNGNLVDLFSYPASQIIVRRDNKGRLLTGTDDRGNALAYQQVDSTGTVVASWHPHQLIHAKYDPVDSDAYSASSFLTRYRLLAKRIDWVESAMVTARLSRAWPRNKHLVDLTGKSNEEARKALERYVRSFTTKVTPNGIVSTVPLEPDSDIFVTKGYRTGPDQRLYPSLSDVELLDPNGSGFAADNDIRHLVNQLFDIVPAENLGLGERQSPDLTGEDVAYSLFLKNFQYTLEDQIVRRILDLGLLLRGYRAVPYALVFSQPTGSQSWKWADAQFRSSLAFRTELEAKATNRVEYLKRVRGYSEEQALAVLARYKEEEAEFGSLSPADKTGLIARGNMSAGLERDDDPVTEIIKSLETT